MASGEAGLPFGGRLDVFYLLSQNHLTPLPCSVPQNLTHRDSIDGLLCLLAFSWRDRRGEVRALISQVPSSCKVTVTHGRGLSYCGIAILLSALPLGLRCDRKPLRY